MIPFQITFRDFPPSDAIWIAVQNRIEKLERLFSRIVKCDVVLSCPHRHRRSTRFYHAQIHLSIGGEDVFINRAPDKDEAHVDIYVAIRDAFNAAERKLQSRVGKLRRDVKSHAEPTFAKISRVVSNEGYGFITTFDGREIYFHRNSVIDADFEKLQPGQEVRFSEETGNEGPQVSSMSVVHA